MLSTLRMAHVATVATTSKGKAAFSQYFVMAVNNSYGSLYSDSYAMRIVVPLSVRLRMVESTTSAICESPLLPAKRRRGTKY